ncbi:hypothetical protein [Amycolatopsis aidingensis]|uniref:hypothetical protein n=1 Tax=Amycolatopsis aidingensis TaxID=2842453 RepID=UPI001C0C9897|nr:hypothetical protein [Amycolatopsis aidingensis]
MRFYHRPLVRVGAAAVGVAAALVLVMHGTGPSNSQAEAEVAPLARQAAAAESPPHIVEDFGYPGADAIFAERGVRLLKGNGNLLLTDCGRSGLIEVLSNDLDRICFEVPVSGEAETRGGGGPRAWLTMEIPSVFLIKGDSNESEATLTTEEGTKVYDIEPNKYNSVGEGADPDGGPQDLLKITVY